MRHLCEYSKFIFEDTANSIVDLSIISTGMTIFKI